MRIQGAGKYNKKLHAVTGIVFPVVAREVEYRKDDKNK
ncbi:Uncharacterised protein [uncultured archaeon]|nr:Uncharacterised protein [uncultured archaeon]